MRDVHAGDSAAFRGAGMVGFRNVAVHDSRKRDLDVAEAIVARHLDGLLAFARIAVRTLERESSKPPNMD